MKNKQGSSVISLQSLIPKVYLPSFDDLVFGHRLDEAIYEGGRGSLKSTVASYETVLSVVYSQHGDSAICFRRHANGLRDSVYAECIQAIERLGLSDYFEERLSPLSLIYKPTGGKILFRGMDNPSKIKGIKLKQGQFCFAWFEELQEVEDIVKLRSIIQSVARGERETKIVYTFNPPVSALHWVNTDMVASDRVIKLHTTYLQVPSEWLGVRFIKIANTLKLHNELAYRNEYLGECVGGVGMIFPNVKMFKDINKSDFKILYRGIDFGFTTDPATYVVWAYDKKSHSLYAVHEFYGKGVSNKTLSEEIKFENKHGFTVRCDSAEPKSISDLVTLGINGAVPCSKGRDSVRFGIKWLQGVANIYIDPDLTPNIYREFTQYEYFVRNGVSTGEYPDKNNHTIDATRYAAEPLILSA